MAAVGLEEDTIVLKTLKDYHIILDLDGTLIDEDRLISRPYLKEFLTYLFENFGSVSIWTAAGQKRLENALKLEAFQNKNFFFTWTGKYCSFKTNTTAIENGEFYAQRLVSKPLKKVWKTYKELNRNNTLILDNTPSTYKGNYGNSLPISTYVAPNQDEALLKLIKYLPSLAGEHLRSVNKRGWENSY